MPRKQSVWIIRYGLTKFPLVEDVGPFDSDLDPNEGMEHAKCIARRVFHDADDAPSVIYCSPFVRCAHTAQLMALTSSSSQQKHQHRHHISEHHDITHVTKNIHPMVAVRVESGLTEWYTPSLWVNAHNGTVTRPKSPEQLAQVFGIIDLSHASVNPMPPSNPQQQQQQQQQPDGGKLDYVETEQDLLQRCATTMDALLQLHSGGNNNNNNNNNNDAAINIAIVSHAPIDQALALFLEGAPTLQESKLGPWPLGGVTKFSRLVPSNENDASSSSSSDSVLPSAWTMECYGETSHMPAKYKHGVKHWSLPCLERTAAAAAAAKSAATKHAIAADDNPSSSAVLKTSSSIL